MLRAEAAHTPFQWAAQDSIAALEEKQRKLRDALRSVKGVKFNWHDARLSMLEAVFSRGDRRLSDVLVRAFEAGCRFDSWKEQFDFGKWQHAFEDAGLDPRVVCGAASAERTKPFRGT